MLFRLHVGGCRVQMAAPAAAAEENVDPEVTHIARRIYFPTDGMGFSVSYHASDSDVHDQDDPVIIGGASQKEVLDFVKEQVTEQSTRHHPTQ